MEEAGGQAGQAHTWSLKDSWVLLKPDSHLLKMNA